ncbi:hypothetical protein CCP3SC1_160057 [Gammaproteobacteria bacterium]
MMAATVISSIIKPVNTNNDTNGIILTQVATYGLRP